MDRNSHTSVSLTTGTLVRGALIILFFYLLYLIRDTILIVLTSIVIASFVESAVRKLKKYRFNRTLTAVLVYFLVIAAFGGVFYAFVPILLGELSSIATLLAQYFPSSGLLHSLQGETFTGARDIFNSLTHVSLQGLIGENGVLTGSGNVSGVFKSLVILFGGIVNLLLILIISFYLSIQERGIENFLRIVVPLQYEDYVIGIWQRTERKIGLWIQGQLLLGLIIGIAIYIGLLIMGVPYALLLALLAGLTELIPFGLILAIIPAIVFAYVDGGLHTALWVGLFYIIVQQLENYLIAPMIVKRVTGVPTLVVILSLLIGAKLGGVWGIILAIPVAVCFLEIMSDMEKKKVAAKVGATDIRI